MSRFSCNACQKCGENCDRCGLCENNIITHNELFYLADNFKEIVEKANKNLFDKVLSINEKLNYNLNDTLSISVAENYLNLLTNKKENIENDRKNLENEIFQITHEHLVNLEKLKVNHEKKIRDDYYEFMQKKSNYYDYYKQIQNEINSSIKEKKEKKKKLEKNKVYKSDEINDNFINEKKKIFKEEYNKNKIEIDEELKVNEEKFEYTKEELKLKNECLNQIQKLKEYSKIIPNFQNCVESFGLQKYIFN